MARINPQRAELGKRLKQLRERAGLVRSRVDRDEQLRWHDGKTSRMERGDRVPVAAEVNRLADLYHASRDERDTLHLLADAARKREAMPRVADFARTYLAFEKRARRIRAFDEVLFHGLVQSRGYMTALLGPDATDLAGQVEERLARNVILDSGARIEIVIGEAALYRVAGDRSTMIEQLEYVLRAADKPNVSIQVLPFKAGLHRSVGVGFSLLEMDGAARVYLEGLTTATYIHEPEEVSVYAEGFDELRRLAVSENESATILRERIKSLAEEQA